MLLSSTNANSTGLGRFRDYFPDHPHELHRYLGSYSIPSTAWSFGWSVMP